MGTYKVKMKNMASLQLKILLVGLLILGVFLITRPEMAFVIIGVLVSLTVISIFIEFRELELDIENKRFRYLTFMFYYKKTDWFPLPTLDRIEMKPTTVFEEGSTSVYQERLYMEYKVYEINLIPIEGKRKIFVTRCDSVKKAIKIVEGLSSYLSIGHTIKYRREDT